MNYTTDLVTVNVPEGAKIVLTFKDEEGEIDLTTHAVLIIDEAVRTHKTFIHDLTQNKNEEVYENQETIEEKIETVLTEIAAENKEKEVTFGEISFPETIEVTVAQIKLHHSKAGDLLATGVGRIITEYAQNYQNTTN